MSDSLPPMDCSPPGSSAHGVLQARVLEWGPLPSLPVCIFDVIYDIFIKLKFSLLLSLFHAIIYIQDLLIST